MQSRPVALHSISQQSRDQAACLGQWSLIASLCRTWKVQNLKESDIPALAEMKSDKAMQGLQYLESITAPAVVFRSRSVTVGLRGSELGIMDNVGCQQREDHHLQPKWSIDHALGKNAGHHQDS